MNNLTLNQVINILCKNATNKEKLTDFDKNQLDLFFDNIHLNDLNYIMNKSLLIILEKRFLPFKRLRSVKEDEIIKYFKHSFNYIYPRYIKEIEKNKLEFGSFTF